MRCRKIKKKSWPKIICFSGSIYLVVYFYCVIYLVERETIPCQPSKHHDNETVRYIFNLEPWRSFILDDRTFSKNHQTLLCAVPAELRSISDTICQLFNRRSCTHLPCQMIRSTLKTLEDIQCMKGGRIMKTNDDKLTKNQPDYICKRGFSLDLFLKKSDDFSYPSIIGDAVSPLSKDLYIDVLNNKFRSCDSMWGLKFNFESITNYPWAADRNMLQLFDITFGYDRSLYDLIPAPWLFNYVDRLKFSSKRLSVQKVMNDKKPIYSATTSDVYWSNMRTQSTVTQENESNTSYVTAPILWMNSNCNTPSKRTEYMEELMKYIDVDNYGTCGRNIRSLPKHIVNIQNSKNQNLKDRGSYNWEAGKLALSSEYLFTVAIENSVNYDYITEKLWHALIAGSIPIYLGAPNVQDWLPCETACIIDLKRFKTPKEVAMYIKAVATNRTLYERYHQWRNKPLPDKFQNMLNYFENISDYSLECILCDMSHRVGQGEDSKDIKRTLISTIGHF